MISFRKAALVLLLFLLFAPGYVSAADGGVSLSLLDAYKLALLTNEDVKIAKERFLQSEMSVDAAFAQRLPQVSANAYYRKYSEEKSREGFAGDVVLQPSSSTTFDLRVEQLLYGGGRTTSLNRARKKEAYAKLVAVEEATEGLLIETARVYYNSLKAAREVEIKEASLKRATEQQRVSRARLKAGTATRSVVLRADAEAAGLEADLTAARNYLKNSLVRLMRITGAEATPIVSDPPHEEPSEGMPGSVDQFIRDAFMLRRDYRALVIEQEVSEEDITYARGAYLPTVTLEGVYAYRDQNPEVTFDSNDSLYAGLNLSVPIFEGGLRRAEVGEARSLAKEAQLERLKLKKDIEIEVREAYNNVESLEYVRESFIKQHKFAKENYEMVFKQFTYGLLDNMDLIDADSTLVEAEMGLMNAIYDHQLGLVELKNSAGLLLGDVENKLKER